MSSLHIPTIAFNSMTNLKPELIGLAAWLAASEIYPHDRRSIMEHVAEGGDLDESILYRGFKSIGQVADAAKAHSAWLAFIADLAHEHTARSLPMFHRNGNGHKLELPPIAGGAPFNPQSRDYDGMVMAEAGDDIEF